MARIAPLPKSSAIVALATHGFAALVACGYMATLFRYGHVATSALFVAPALILTLAHACAKAATGGHWSPRDALRGAVGTASLLVLAALSATVAMPQTGSANALDVAEPLGALIVCVAFAFVVILAVAGVAYVLFHILRYLFRLIRPKRAKGDPPDGRVRDGAAFVLVVAVVLAASFEGVPGGFDFARGDSASATRLIAAPPENVWAAIGKASSPGLPLPVWLMPFPRAVSVADSGADIGSRRVVHFRGREGEGDLVLEVSARTPASITWSVAGDTTPFASWAAMRDITYRLEAAQGGTRLTVTARYRRLLSPALFFAPYMRLVVGAAMGVLAQDKQDRAEALARGRV